VKSSYQLGALLLSVGLVSTIPDSVANVKGIPHQVHGIDQSGAGSSPSSLLDVNGTLFFIAHEGIHGSELWKSDGTEAGTVMVTDIFPGQESSFPSFPPPMANVKGTLFFIANDGVHGSELWMSNGTRSGTVLVKDIFPGKDSSSLDVSVLRPLTDVNGTLFFIANDGTHGLELWKSDGTEAGTVMLKDIRSDSHGSGPFSLAAVDNILYLAANDGMHGKELWRSDGTPAGTRMVRDILKGSRGSNPSLLTDLRGALLFEARHALWRSDGTRAGTLFLKRWKAIFVDDLTAVRRKVFLAVREVNKGDQLWKSDGTSAGTLFMKDIHPRPTCIPNELTAVGHELFFNAGEHTHGQELWKSDGTTVGTGLVKDVWPGPDRFPAFDQSCQYGPFELADVSGTLYFNTDDGTHGTELWKSDGTVGGTRLVRDIWPGQQPPNGAGPNDLTDVNGTLYFSAHDGTHGFELWSSDGTKTGTVMVRDIDPTSTPS